MPAGAGEGDGGRSYHGSGARKSASEEFIVGELEEGLRVPLLSGREKEELGFEDEGEDNGSDAEPCAFLDLFVLADKVGARDSRLACVAVGTHVFAEFFEVVVVRCNALGHMAKIGMRRESRKQKVHLLDEVTQPPRVCSFEVGASHASFPFARVSCCAAAHLPPSLSLAFSLPCVGTFPENRLAHAC